MTLVNTKLTEPSINMLSFVEQMFDCLGDTHELCDLGSVWGVSVVITIGESSNTQTITQYVTVPPTQVTCQLQCAALSRQ